MAITRRGLITSAATSIFFSIGIPRKIGAAMIEPITPAEQLMYCTARIVCPIPNSTNVKTGTGFFYNIPAENNQSVPILVTNKHVIEGAASVDFVAHASSVKDAKKPDSNRALMSDPKTWIPHPDPKIDLCALPIAEIANSTTPYPFLRTLDPGLIKPDSELGDLNAVEDVLMVGYPNGLWDAANNFPLIRRGITASHPGVDFDVNGVACTVVDIASFPGSSGSPVFIYNNGAITDKKNNVTFGQRVIFLGVLFSGPTFQPDGTIVIRNIPTVNVPVPAINMMLNLGYLIKAKEIHGLASAMLAKFNLKPP